MLMHREQPNSINNSEIAADVVNGVDVSVERRERGFIFGCRGEGAQEALVGIIR